VERILLSLGVAPEARRDLERLKRPLTEKAQDLLEQDFETLMHALRYDGHLKGKELNSGLRFLETIAMWPCAASLYVPPNSFRGLSLRPVQGFLAEKGEKLFQRHGRFVRVGTFHDLAEEFRRRHRIVRGGA
jgi:hypothetical protein